MKVMLFYYFLINFSNQLLFYFIGLLYFLYFIYILKLGLNLCHVFFMHFLGCHINLFIFLVLNIIFYFQNDPICLNNFDNFILIFLVLFLIVS